MWSRLWSIGLLSIILTFNNLDDIRNNNEIMLLPKCIMRNFVIRILNEIFVGWWDQRCSDWKDREKFKEHFSRRNWRKIVFVRTRSRCAENNSVNSSCFFLRLLSLPQKGLGIHIPFWGYRISPSSFTSGELKHTFPLNYRKVSATLDVSERGNQSACWSHFLWHFYCVMPFITFYLFYRLHKCRIGF
jgi:hypothetical protein